MPCLSISQSDGKISIIGVFDLDKPVDEFEEIEIKVLNQIGKVVAIQTAGDVFLKQASKIGKKDFNDIVVADPYAALFHCELDWTKWFKKTRTWVRQFKVLVQSKSLNFAIWRNIIDFIREPRCVTIRDFGCPRGTWVALNPLKTMKLSKNMVLKIENSISIVVTDMGPVKPQKRLKILGNTNELGVGDNIETREDRAQGSGELDEVVVPHILALQLKSEINSELENKTLIVTREEERFVVASYEDDSYCEEIAVGPYEFEVIFNKGEWYYQEVEQRDKKMKTWLNIACLPKREFSFKEDTEILVGKSTVMVSFGNKGSNEPKQY